MTRWDPRLRVLAGAGAIVGTIWLMRSQEGDMRLAIAELAAIPLLFALYLCATGLQELFGSGGSKSGAAKGDEPPDDAAG